MYSQTQCGLILNNYVVYFPLPLDLVTEYWLVFMQTDVILVVPTIDLLLTVQSAEIELHFWDHPGRKMKITK